MGVAVPPAKANPPLGVDADAVLAFAATPKRFQSIPRRCSQVVEPLRAVKIEQLATRNSLERTKSRNIAIMKQVLRVFRGERPDHGNILLRIT
jgi:uncharacterized membrane protein